MAQLVSFPSTVHQEIQKGSYHTSCHIPYVDREEGAHTCPTRLVQEVGSSPCNAFAGLQRRCRGPLTFICLPEALFCCSAGAASGGGSIL
jgi:hypothetical protein